MVCSQEGRQSWRKPVLCLEVSWFHSVFLLDIHRNRDFMPLNWFIMLCLDFRSHRFSFSTPRHTLARSSLPASLAAISSTSPQPRASQAVSHTARAAGTGSSSPSGAPRAAGQGRDLQVVGPNRTLRLAPPGGPGLRHRREGQRSSTGKRWKDAEESMWYRDSG